MTTAGQPFDKTPGSQIPIFTKHVKFAPYGNSSNSEAMSTQPPGSYTPAVDGANTTAQTQSSAASSSASSGSASRETTEELCADERAMLSELRAGIASLHATFIAHEWSKAIEDFHAFEALGIARVAEENRRRAQGQATRHEDLPLIVRYLADEQNKCRFQRAYQVLTSCSQDKASAENVEIVSSVLEDIAYLLPRSSAAPLFCCPPPLPPPPSVARLL